MLSEELMTPETKRFAEHMATTLTKSMMHGMREGLEANPPQPGGSIAGTILGMAYAFRVFLQAAPSDSTRTMAIALFLKELGDSTIDIDPSEVMDEPKEK